MSCSAMFSRLHLTLVACLAVFAMLTIPVMASDEEDRLFVLRFPVGETGSGTIQAFDIGIDGAPIAAEAYPSYGTGDGMVAPMDLAFAMGDRYLYATNNIDRSIAEYQVLEDGSLEAIAGTPIPVMGTPVALEAHPEAAVLYALAGFNLIVFGIGGDGALTELQQIPVVVPAALDISPDGRFLFVAARFGPDEGVVVFELAADGTVVTQLPSPQGFEIDRPSKVHVDSDGENVYLLDLDEGLTTFSAEADGTLTATDQTAWGTFTTQLELTDDDRFLYVGDRSDGLRAMEIGASGVPTELPGSPFPVAQGGAIVELIAPPDTSRLYWVTRDALGIQTFDIEEDGTLVSIGEPVDAGVDRAMAAAYLGKRSLEVEIDIRPGNPTNPVNPRSRGVIPVAILGSATVAADAIDPASCRFGAGEAMPVHGGHIHDVDGDGTDDLLLHFATSGSGILCGDTEATLTGLLSGGGSILGTDTITTVGCNSPRPSRRNGMRPPSTAVDFGLRE